jgi:glycosyltransferase involved in cell wall biosynthesis
MRITMTHGYMLSGSGSNVYVQNLCRALVRTGHEVHLLCQDKTPFDHDFVDATFTADPAGVKPLQERETDYPGSCAVYRPEIGDLLPVYVYDRYPGWRVKTFLDLTDEEFEEYVSLNVTALDSVIRATGEPVALVTNHSVPAPLISRRALQSFPDTPYISVVHGSCLQYVARRSEKYMQVAREGLEGAARIVALSGHSVGTIAEDFPQMTDKTIALPGGVDTTLFDPGSLDRERLASLGGGPGRGPQQEHELRELLQRKPCSAQGLASGLAGISDAYSARAHDTDAGERLAELLKDEAPLVLYVGKLIHSKGVHSLLAAFAMMRANWLRTAKSSGVRQSRAPKLLVVGFGTFREALQALTLSLDKADRQTVGLLAGSGKLYEGGPESPMEHFALEDASLEAYRGLHKAVEFVGPLQHAELARLLPAADVAVVPSIFPETFGLVAAEFAAAGVPPFVADHSGLREAGGTVAVGLPFDTRVPMDDLVGGLARALGDYLALPAAEREACREKVRRNSVEHLGWDGLARKVTELAAALR